MADDCIAGVDFGTSKIAIVVIDPKRNSILFTESEPYGGDIGLANPSLKEQSVEGVMDAFNRLFGRLENELRAGARSLRSIGLTGQMHGIVGLDGDGKAVTELVTWQDGRGNALQKGGKTLIQLMEERGGRRRIASGYGIVTLFDWTLNRRYPRLAGFCTISDYAGMLLTGKKGPSMDPTMAESTGAFDLEKGAWDERYIAALGIDRGLFPPVLPTRTVIGDARGFGPPGRGGGGGVPVTVSLGDNQASFIGSVRELYSSLLVNIGTGSQVSFAADSAREAHDLADIDGYDVTLRPFVDGGVLVAGSALSGGVVYRTLHDFFAEAGRELFNAETGASRHGSLYDLMERLAGSGDDAGGLEVYPLFAGKRSDPSARGRIGGISLANLTPRNLIRATLEGEVRILREMITEKALRTANVLVGSGNGIRRNSLLRSIASRVFGKTLRTPAHEEEAALGAAIHGAVAAGVYRGYGEARDVISYD